jgi:formylglycine-generating enzyme required for sulfatase activity/class 3 adenylate cyclase/tRNA A-37 threonylcarbamoyl transferase component Bud32
MEKLGHFRIVGVLGEGAMGEVFHAIDEKLDRPVALKVLHLKLANQEYAQYAARLMQEARSAARLNHPNIITMFDCGEIDGCTYLSMEMVKGRNLRSILDETPVMPVSKVITLAAELFDALAFAHQAQVVHRDIKPANLMFNAEGRLKITDFGIAQLPNSDLTQTNMVLGSPLYMSPEQLESSRVDGRADIFSAGVVLYEALTGGPPFTGKNIGAIAYKIVTEEPPAPSTVNPQVPQWLSDIVMHCLRKKPEDRYQTADVALAELREKSAALTGAATVAATGVSATVARAATEHASPLAATFNQTYTSSVVFLDIVGYSKLANDVQSKLKQQFNALLKLGLDQLPTDQRVIVDTGDGAAIAFLTDQVAALRFLDRYVRFLKDYPDLKIRTGVNLGPCQVVEDINGGANLIGDGINAAQRVMSFAPTGEVLVARSFFDAATWISSEYAARLSFFDNKKDKHGRTHELYRFGAAADKGAVDPTLVMKKADAARSKPWAWIGVGVLVLAVALGGALAFKFKDSLRGQPAASASLAQSGGGAAPSTSAPPLLLPPPPEPTAAPQAATLSAADLIPGKTFKDCPDCPEMVVLPAGKFMMGSEKFDPRHAVHAVAVAQPFALGKTPVTQGQWRAVMGSNPSGFASCGDICPVERVTWTDAHDYTRKLSEMTGKTYRLPSEAEWEYACRAGTRQEYCGGNDANLVAWHAGNSGNTTHPVATKQANAWGLFDMSGNVWQWTEDCWNDTYKGAPSTATPWTAGACAAARVMRGGSWGNDALLARAENRSRYGPGNSGDSLGFRVARVVP